MPDVEHFFFGKRTMNRHAYDEMLARIPEGTNVIFQLHARSVSPGTRFEQAAYEVGHVCLL